MVAVTGSRHGRIGCADVAAEAVRALNDATLPNAGRLTGPGRDLFQDHRDLAQPFSFCRGQTVSFEPV